MSKAETRRANAAANGTIVKRPHVAAGFAGQKPPPKLPQAIAEAANKKQATRKKRVSAAAARAAASAAAAASTAASTTTTTTSTMAMLTPRGDSVSPMASTNSSSTPEIANSAMHSLYGHDHSQVVAAAASPTASLGIPSTFEPQDQASNLSQQQQQQTDFFAQHRLFSLGRHRDSIAFHHQLQRQNENNKNISQGYMPYEPQPFGSMTIPLSSDPTIANYGSLVVPASSSTSSSPTLSPRTTRANSVSTARSTMDESGHLNLFQMQQQQQQHQQQQHQLGYATNPSQMQGLMSGFDMSNFDSVAHQHQRQQQQQLGPQDSQVHPFTLPQGQNPYGQHQHQHHQHPSLTIGEDGFAEFGLGMNESLEALMKKNMGSLDRLMATLSNDSHHHHQQQYQHQHQQYQQQRAGNGHQTPSTLHPDGGANVFDPSIQMSYLQHVHQQQKQGVFQDMSRSVWVPNQAGAFAIPLKTEEFSWSASTSQSQQQQQQQSSQSINISANDSPQAEMELELEQLQNQQQQQQQQMSAHALFQQQHQQQQQRYLEQLQQKQQQQQQQQQNLQLRKGSFVVGMPQQPQQHPHRASIQHQHQQTFYIPQMQDDDDEDDNGGFQSMYDDKEEEDSTQPTTATAATPASSSSMTVPIITSEP